MSEPSAWTAVGISIVAVVASVFAIIASSRASSRSNDLQERLLRLENTRERDRRIAAQRANVVAFMTGLVSNQRLFFRNEGEGTARGIEAIRKLAKVDFACAARSFRPQQSSKGRG